MEANASAVDWISFSDCFSILKPAGIWPFLSAAMSSCIVLIDDLKMGGWPGADAGLGWVDLAAGIAAAMGGGIPGLADGGFGIEVIGGLGRIDEIAALPTGGTKTGPVFSRGVDGIGIVEGFTTEGGDIGDGPCVKGGLEVRGGGVREGEGLT